MKTFNIGDRVVTVKALTLGDLKEMRKTVAQVGEEEAPYTLIEFCTDITVKEIEELDISKALEVDKISIYLAELISGKKLG